jgi:hypothetical protein
MAAITVRSVQAAALHSPVYERVLPLAIWEIVVANTVIALPAIVAFLTLPPVFGVAALVFAATFAILDAEFITPWRVDVWADGVTLHFWHRAPEYASSEIVVVHDVPVDRFVLHRRSGFPTFARFQDEDSAPALRAFMTAGVEVVSR